MTLRRIFTFTLVCIIFIMIFFLWKTARTEIQSENLTSPCIELSERLLHAYFEQLKENTKKHVDQVAKAIGQDREFILALFLDGNPDAPVVRKEATKYGTLLGLDFLQISDSAHTQVSFYGGITQCTFPEANTSIFALCKDTLFVAHTVKSSENLYLSGGYILSLEKLQKLKNIFHTDLIVQSGKHISISTISPKPSHIKSIANDSLMVDDTLFRTLTYDLAPDLRIILLLNSY